MLTKKVPTTVPLVIIGSPMSRFFSHQVEIFRKNQMDRNDEGSSNGGDGGESERKGYNAHFQDSILHNSAALAMTHSVSSPL